MNMCAHIEEVEELALGNVATDSEQADQLRAHLDVCNDCRSAHEMFAEERALFAARADVLPPAPFLEIESLDADAADTRTLFARVMPAVLAIAACFAAVAGVDKLHAGIEGDPIVMVKSAEPSSSKTVKADQANALALAANDEGSDMTCAMPARYAANASALTSDIRTSSESMRAAAAVAVAPATTDEATCNAIMSRSDRSTCE